MQSVSATKEETQAPAHLTETIVDKLKNPSTSSDFDLHEGVNQVLADVGMSAADSGGQLTFYGQDPIVPSRIRFATTAGIGLAAKTIAAAAIWRDRTGQGQDIHVDIRKAFRRFSGFFDGIWETVNGRSPAMGVFENSPFLKFPLFRETRDGRHITCLSFYPKAHQRALNFFRCSDSLESLQNSILQWRADDLEVAAAEEGLILGKVRTFEEFSKELQYTEVLAKMPLISVEKIGESEPVPFKPDAKAPLDGIRAFGMGHVIAGAGMGRDLAFYGADVLNIWRPDNAEVEAFFWDVQVGMRSTILDSSKEDRAKFDTLLKDADIFFANKRPG
jgi:crotonobetainyl-CoA:carnitine CoA-transferase CaiB-like acyl-CoA transferase